MSEKLDCSCRFVTNYSVHDRLLEYCLGWVSGFTGILSWLRKLFALNGGPGVLRNRRGTLVAQGAVRFQRWSGCFEKSQGYSHGYGSCSLSMVVRVFFFPRGGMQVEVIGVCISCISLLTVIAKVCFVQLYWYMREWGNGSEGIGAFRCSSGWVCFSPATWCERVSNVFIYFYLLYF